MPNPIFRDPWANREAWRKHPVFSNRAMFANLFPGLGIAIVAFSAYVLADNLYLSKPKPEISHESHH
ncbi:NADH-ubiquinone oxidoreductase B12 subunit family-domain-containing protein [Mycena filopes]|nr:NADH-ubiquinone oxidoreductase B12 subunit family-domain-containing protein [Mycena filopes]